MLGLLTGSNDPPGSVPGVYGFLLLYLCQTQCLETIHVGTRTEVRGSGGAQGALGPLAINQLSPSKVNCQVGIKLVSH